MVPAATEGFPPGQTGLEACPLTLGGFVASRSLSSFRRWHDGSRRCRRVVGSGAGAGGMLSAQ